MKVTQYCVENNVIFEKMRTKSVCKKKPPKTVYNNHYDSPYQA